MAAAYIISIFSSRTTIWNNNLELQGKRIFKIILPLELV